MQLQDDWEALIDDADESLTIGIQWRAVHIGRQHYVAGYDPAFRHYFLHRLITAAPDEVHVDHRDRNGLNNQRSNLRLASPSQNHANRLPNAPAGGKSSRYKGVHFAKREQKWAAQICVDYRHRFLGYHATEAAAAIAYDHAAVVTWGEFALTNAMIFGKIT